MEIIDFRDKFEEYLKEEARGFYIPWEQVDIKAIHYHSTLRTVLPEGLDEYIVRMRVVKDEIPAGTNGISNRDNWFRSHKFIYGMMSKSVRTESEQTDLMTFDIGTIESIAMKTREAFRDFHGW